MGSRNLAMQLLLQHSGGGAASGLPQMVTFDSFDDGALPADGLWTFPDSGAHVEPEVAATGAGGDAYNPGGKSLLFIPDATNDVRVFYDLGVDTPMGDGFRFAYWLRTEDQTTAGNYFLGAKDKKAADNAWPRNGAGCEHRRLDNFQAYGVVNDTGESSSAMTGFGNWDGRNWKYVRVDYTAATRTANYRMTEMNGGAAVGAAGGYNFQFSAGMGTNLDTLRYFFMRAPNITTASYHGWYYLLAFWMGGPTDDFPAYDYPAND
jgi:hypothetical protein